jgi:hypothetical protein
MKRLVPSLCALFVAGLAATAGATPLTLTNVTVRSSYNGGPTEQMVLNFGSDTAAGTPVFTSDGTTGFSWMNAGDYIDFYGYNDGTHDRSWFDVGFSSNDSFVVSDTIHMEFELAPGYIFGPAATALIKAIDVQIPTATLNGNLLTFDITALDQIPGNGGLASYESFTESAPVPEPATLTLVALGGTGLIGRRRLRRRK